MRGVSMVAVVGCSFAPHAAAVDPDATDAPVVTDVLDAASIDVNADCIQPAAFWRFDEGAGTSALDSSGHGNTLTLNGTATWEAGHTGMALSLPGGSWAEVAYNTTFEVSRKLSVTAWIRPSTVSRTGAIVAKSARLGPVMDWGFYQEFAEGLFIYNFPSPDIRGRTSGLAIAADTWTHVAFVLDVDVGTTAFYKNGTFHSTLPMTTALLQNNSEPIIVGTDGGNTANDFLGGLDDIMIWTRALTAGDVGVLHGGGCAR